MGKRIKSRGLSGVRMILIGAALSAVVVSAAIGSGCHRGGKKWNVLIVTMDTTRADHLRCYGYQWIETPTLNQLASQGVLFERAYSCVPLTLPAHASIMTGTVPLYHGVEDNGAYRVPDNLDTMAEILKGKGYQTAAFLSAAVLKSVFNLNQGFDTYDDSGIEPQKQMSSLVAERKGDKTTDAAMAWLSEHYQKPFFAWVHYYDPHAEYDPPPPFDTMYGIPYDGEIAFMDTQIRRLMVKLTELGVYENTLIIVVGDHGESLGEHSEPTHSLFIYDGTQHIPLIIRMPDNPFPGKRVKKAASQIDILSTVLDYLGIPVPPQDQGASLRPIMESADEPEADRFAFMESKMAFLHYGWAPLSGIADGRYKYIKAPTPELYDLGKDKKELINLWEQHCLDDTKPGPDCKRANQMRVRLEGLERNWGKAKLESVEADISPQMKAQLEALGYVVGGFHGNLEKAVTKDPKDYKSIIMPLQNMNRFVKDQDFKKLMELADKVMAVDPENPMALDSRAEALYGMGEYDKAIATYQLILQIHGSTVEKPYRKMGTIYIRMSAVAKTEGKDGVANEDLAKAKENFKRSIEIAPRNPAAKYYLGRLQVEDGGTEELNQAIANFQSPGLADSDLGHVGMALVYEKQGRDGLAEAEFERAGEVAGDRSLIYWQEMAQYLIRHNRKANALELLEKALEKDKTLQDEPMFMKTLNELKAPKNPEPAPEAEPPAQ
ncbi:MAG TPA: sulfatase-like hydrolase/transferase [bacterium]|nr:sulfatase-like hydrolase/transferase [bacterium]